MAYQTNIDLNEHVRPVMSDFHRFASKYLIHVLLSFCYLVPLSLGLRFYDFFMLSPLVKYSAKILGFCASAISFVPAYLIAGIVLGKFQFAKRVFQLHSRDDFNIAIALVFLIAPIAVFLARSINRTASSYPHRKFLFCVAFIIVMVTIFSILEYMTALIHQNAYIFSCSVIGGIYFVLFGLKK